MELRQIQNPSELMLSDSGFKRVRFNMVKQMERMLEKKSETSKEINFVKVNKRF